MKLIAEEGRKPSRERFVSHWVGRGGGCKRGSFPRWLTLLGGRSTRGKPFVQDSVAGIHCSCSWAPSGMLRDLPSQGDP